MAGQVAGDTARAMASAPRTQRGVKQEVVEGIKGHPIAQGDPPIQGDGKAGDGLQEALRNAMGGTEELKEHMIESSKLSAPGGLPGNPIADLFSKITFELPNSNKRFQDEGNANKSSQTGAFVSLHHALVDGLILKATIRIDYVKGMDEEGPYEDKIESFKWYSKSFGRDMAVAIDKGYPEVQIAMDRFQVYVEDMYRNWRSELELKTAQKAGPVHVPKGFTRVRPPKEEVKAPAPAPAK